MKITSKMLAVVVSAAVFPLIGNAEFRSRGVELPDRTSWKDFVPVNVDADANDGVVFDLKTDKFEFLSFVWRNATPTNGYMLFTSPDDGRSHRHWLKLSTSRTYKRYPAAAWRGKISGVAVAERAEMRGIEVSNLKFVKGTPDIAPDPVIVCAAPESAIPRAGRPLVFEVIVRNFGTRPLTEPVITVNGKQTRFAAQIGGSIGGSLFLSNYAAHGDSEGHYLVELPDPGVGEYEYVVQAAFKEASAAPKRVRFAVKPSLGLAACDYPPEPKPVDTAPYRIGAFLFPGWTSHKFNAVWNSMPERKPLLGWYDESKQETIDWQIKHLVENGISFVFVDWYWLKGVHKLAHWEKLFASSRYRRHLKWSLMWANHNGRGSHTIEDQKAVTEFWIKNFFCQPEYMKRDGKPVVAIWLGENMEADMGKGGCRKLLDLSRQMARDAGYPGIWFVVLRHGEGNENPAFLRKFADFGFDETTVYKYNGAESPRQPDFINRALDFSWVADDSIAHWREIERLGPLPFIPSITTGWDNRPWLGNAGWTLAKPNVAAFRRICEDAKRFAKETGHYEFIVGPMDEWGEGSIGYPNREHGFGFLEAIRDTFGNRPADGWPVNYAPEDIGLKVPVQPGAEAIK